MIPEQSARPVVFLAPGSGLGHLVRTGALALELERERVPSLILSSSPWAPGFSKITGLCVISLPPSRWKAEAPAHVKRLKPRLMVLDSFPLGFRGEDIRGGSRDCATVYLARHLNFQAYRSAIRAQGGGVCDPDLTAIVIEDLADDHRDWLERHSRARFRLDGRIRFPVSRIRAPEPPSPLQSLWKRGPVHLVVHSGPEHEVRQLINLAEQSMQAAGAGVLAVINPLLAGRGEPHCYDYFPASLLYPESHRIYTGAGYNAVAEAQRFSDKHRVIPFERCYDDQFWRAGHKNAADNGNGRRQAAAALLEWSG